MRVGAAASSTSCVKQRAVEGSAQRPEKELERQQHEQRRDGHPYAPARPPLLRPLLHDVVGEHGEQERRLQRADTRRRGVEAKRPSEAHVHRPVPQVEGVREAADVHHRRRADERIEEWHRQAARPALRWQAAEANEADSGGDGEEGPRQREAAVNRSVHDGHRKARRDEQLGGSDGQLGGDA